MSIAGGAAAQERARINIEPQPLASALNAFGAQTGSPVISTPELTRTKVSPGVREADDPGAALTQLLAGTGLSYRCSGDTYLIVPAPQTQPAPSQTRCVARAGAGGSDGDAADAGTVEALIVTAQKKDEDIQDVPIAISAFSQKSLDAQKIEGGFDLLKAVPNVTFSKTNFSGYNFSIRGIGTQAVSVTTDPGVAVAQNNTTLIVNRLFEQEYVDMERVEVLRGPQGTLYGRNATAGVINVITAKPVLGDFFGEAKLETGNFNAQRFRGHINVPLGENLAVRGAFALTKRDGYGVNEAAASNDTRPFGDKVREDVDGRDLWTGRLSIGWEPTEAIRVNAIWERFKEDDNRVRTSKQLCHHDEGPKIPAGAALQGIPGMTTPDGYLNINNYNNALMSQACKPGSLYDDGAFGTPMGAAMPYISGLFVATQLGSNIIAGGVEGYKNSFGIGGKPWGGLPADQLPCAGADVGLFAWGGPAHSPVDVCNPDPYGNRMQSRDLRTIYSAIEPAYRADSDIFELSVDFDLGDATFTSQTVYSKDEYYASQDYNRFTSLPLWNDTREACGVEYDIFNKYSGVDCSDNPDTGKGTFAPLTDTDGDGIIDQTHIPVNGKDPFRQNTDQYSVDPAGYVRDQDGRRVGFYRDLAPGGVFCDPQLGCSNSLVAQDLSQAKSRQFNQEFRLVTNYGGDFNFSLGANYTRFETTNDYYVFINALSYLTNFYPFNFHNSPCALVQLICRYVDPNPLESVAGDGHNYFRSQNPYKLTSTAVFGEAYWNITDTLKLTTGLRFTWDEKTFTPVSSQLLLADYRDPARAAPLLPGGVLFGGLKNLPEGAGPEYCSDKNVDLVHCALSGTAPGGRGLVASPDIVQTWHEPTGRIVLDWKPDIGFTNETLVYASAARGYKGGGANPPSVAPPAKYAFDAASGAAFPDVFEPEYVNAFEVGSKNTLFDGALILNGGVFYYDYTDYQVSKIADRRAVNENFDAKIWGAELEWVFAPTRNLRFNGSVGYLKTRIADGERSIDLMDRTNGGHVCYNPKDHNPDSDWDQTFCDWMTLQPFVNAAALSVVPVNLIQANAGLGPEGGVFNLWNYYSPNGGPIGGVANNAGYYDEDGVLVETGDSTRTWTAARDAPNGGAGFFKDLGGNELPSAPRWTFSMGAQYSFTLPAGWDATLRSDFYWQDDSWARVYNLAGYDKLKAWTSTNLSLWVENPDWNVKAEVYVKNLFDAVPITGAFLNSEDSGLTTNVFTLDPRLVGVSVTKSF